VLVEAFLAHHRTPLPLVTTTTLGPATTAETLCTRW